MIRYIFIIVVLLFSVQIAGAKHLHQEKEYQAAWCESVGGQMEVVLDDKTRVDCLTDQYAIEVDFAPKWAESIGQALFYGLKTSRQPGVLLIMKDIGDDRYLERLNLAAGKYGIKVWQIVPEEL